MKRLIGAFLAVSLIAGTAAITFAQDKQDPQKQDGKGTGSDGKNGKDTSKGKDGKDTSKGK
jgi:opacity protein-like surface antigen